MIRILIIFCTLILSGVSLSLAQAIGLEGRVQAIVTEGQSLRIELTQVEDAAFTVGKTVDFKVGPGDLGIGYMGRLIRAEAVQYNKAWHLEKIFPLDGVGAKAMVDINAKLHKETASMSRRKFVREGDFIPNFALINQLGEFVQARQMQGSMFVLNFIFTRCETPTMCPASTRRMEALQEAARDAGLDGLDFATITFDPEFDSPGVLRQYAEGHGIEHDNFNFLTGTPEVVEDLLRQFGIVTIDEEGTINHTMATLLIDARGKVVHRKEGSFWTTKEFLEKAKLGEI